MLKVISLFTIITVAQGLECGVRINQNDALKEVLHACLLGNRTLEDLWDVTSTSSESDAPDSSSNENSHDNKMMGYSRKTRETVRSPKINYKNDTKSEENSTEKPDQPVNEGCAIQCIFQKLQMTDSNGYPEHGKILENLMKSATTTEFRDFIQDSVDECYQEMEKESGVDSCDYSAKIMECLAEKGKTNCADWPIGNLPFKE